ncbi:hypothetical protein CF319_g3689 [Tilletia indica]|nr:hypothetical protein CF319_g3689 [Tilletia indica]
MARTAFDHDPHQYAVFEEVMADLRRAADAGLHMSSTEMLYHATATHRDLTADRDRRATFPILSPSTTARLKVRADVSLVEDEMLESAIELWKATTTALTALTHGDMNEAHSKGMLEQESTMPAMAIHGDMNAAHSKGMLEQESTMPAMATDATSTYSPDHQARASRLTLNRSDHGILNETTKGQEFTLPSIAAHGTSTVVPDRPTPATQTTLTQAEIDFINAMTMQEFTLPAIAGFGTSTVAPSYPSPSGQVTLGQPGFNLGGAGWVQQTPNPIDPFSNSFIPFEKPSPNFDEYSSLLSQPFDAVLPQPDGPGLLGFASQSVDTDLLSQPFDATPLQPNGSGILGFTSHSVDPSMLSRPFDATPLQRNRSGPLGLPSPSIDHNKNALSNLAHPNQVPGSKRIPSTQRSLNQHPYSADPPPRCGPLSRVFARILQDKGKILAKSMFVTLKTTPKTPLVLACIILYIVMQDQITVKHHRICYRMLADIASELALDFIIDEEGNLVISLKDPQRPYLSERQVRLEWDYHKKRLRPQIAE